MAKIEVLMPKMGESITEATVLSWLKQPGDEVEMDEPILEIATDKVDSEVPSPVDGVIVETFFEKDDVVEVGKVVAIIEAEGEDGGTETNTPETVVSTNVEEKVLEAVGVSSAETGLENTNTQLLEKPQSGRFYSPLVLNIARTEGIGMDELERIPGTGSGDRVTKRDILSYLEAKKSGKVSTPVKTDTTPVTTKTTETKTKSTEISGKPVAPIAEKSFSFSGDYEIVEMDRMRKMIAENMVYSMHTSPHVTSFVEADVTNIFKWRQKNKKAFVEKYGEKLTFTPIFVEAIVKALRDYPMVNISVSGDQIIVKKNINVGIAVALPDGNLIVPVIKNADRMNLVGLAGAVNDLADRARNRKLKPSDLEDGTYSVSNVGTFGNVMGTPIIMQPQVAILAVGAIRKKPAVIETPEGDMIGIRHMMFLSHSYDHRVVDGALGGMFVRKVADYLESFDINREI